jgi:hypothetical protein
MKVKTATLGVVLALFVSWASALGATTPPPRLVTPSTVHLTRPAVTLRHATKGRDLGRTHLLRCAKTHTC